MMQIENKEIIGYKLNGVVSKEIVDKVLDYTGSLYDNLYFVKGHLGGSLVLEAKRLDILDKWFEPVYEKEYTKQEVEILIDKAINFGYSLNFPLEDFFPKVKTKTDWIKENLK